MLKQLKVLFAALPLLGFLTPVHATEPPPPVAESVYSIMDTTDGRGFCTGFRMGDQIITAGHCIKGRTTMFVKDTEGRVFQTAVGVVAYQTSDFAVLEVSPKFFENNPSESLTALCDVPVKTYRAGQEVSYRGYPGPYGLSTHYGRLAASGAAPAGPWGWDLLRTSLPVLGGASGSALQDDQGRVIGIVTGMLTDNSNFSFSTPIKHVCDTLKVLKPLGVN